MNNVVVVLVVVVIALKPEVEFIRVFGEATAKLSS